MKHKFYYYLITIIICTLTSNLKAQEMLEMAELTAGLEFDGYLIRGGYSRLYGKHLITMAGQAHFQNHKTGGFNDLVPAQQYRVNLEYHYELLNYYDRDFSFFAGGGGIVGYENLNSATLNDGGVVPANGEIIYGALASISAEKYLFPISRSNALALLLNFQYNYFFQSLFGEHQINGSLGVRYVF